MIYDYLKVNRVQVSIMSSEKHNISLYLNTDEMKQQLTGTQSNASSSEKYIIHQNDCLQVINIELRDKITKLQEEFNALEEEADGHDERTRYMRNEMKNFVELRNMTNEVLTIFEQKYKISELKHKTINELLMSLRNFIIINRTLSLTSGLLLWYFDKFNIWSLLTSELISGMSTCSVTKLLPMNLNKTKKLLDSYQTQLKESDDKIMKKNKEIKETDGSNDFISKYIESL